MEQFGTDVSELLSQLQSERATVSRAVSQNMELKEQFGELQDKLIQMTNECARAEDEKVNAIALVNKLSRKIEELVRSKKSLIKQNVIFRKVVGQKRNKTTE
jgi:predicted transcriptional regulator